MQVAKRITMEPRQIYGLFMFLALAVFVLARHYQPKSSSAPRLPWWQQAALGLAAFVGGTLGAKACFALFDERAWSSFKDWVIAWTSDGKTITVGLASAYLAVELTKLALGIRVKTGDGFALPLALAMAVGRWGCFFNGCCFGTETSLPWGVAFPNDDFATRRHPTQLYESLFHLGMAGVLYGLIRRDLLRYQRLKFYLISYCVYRFITEFIRPEPEWWLGLTFYQWVSITFAGALAIQWVFDRRLTRPEGGCPDLKALEQNLPEITTATISESTELDLPDMPKRPRKRWRRRSNRRIFFDILFIIGLFNLAGFCGILLDEFFKKEYGVVCLLILGLGLLLLISVGITVWLTKGRLGRQAILRAAYGLFVVIGGLTILFSLGFLAWQSFAGFWTGRLLR